MTEKANAMEIEDERKSDFNAKKTAEEMRQLDDMSKNILESVCDPPSSDEGEQEPGPKKIESDSEESSSSSSESEAEDVGALNQEEIERMERKERKAKEAGEKSQVSSDDSSDDSEGSSSEEGEDLEISESESDSDSENEEEGDEFADFIVSDSEDIVYEGEEKSSGAIRKPKSNGSGSPKKSKQDKERSNYFVDDRAKEGDEENKKKPKKKSKKGSDGEVGVNLKRKAPGCQEDIEVVPFDTDNIIQVEEEFPPEKNFPIPEPFFKIYKGYFRYNVMAAVKPGYHESIKDYLKALAEEKQRIESDTKMKKSDKESELNTIEQKMESYKIQLDSQKTIVNNMTRVITQVMAWIWDGRMNRVKATLYRILFVGEEDRLDYMRFLNPEEGTNEIYQNFPTDFWAFESSKNHSPSCIVTGRPIKAGQAWIMTSQLSTGQVESDIMDFQWCQFFAYWQTLVKHSQMIEGLAESHFKGCNMEPFPTKKSLELLNNNDLIKRCMRLMMLSFAWFYKLLRGTSQGEAMQSTVDDRWYRVCKAPEREEKKDRKESNKTKASPPSLN